MPTASDLIKGALRRINSYQTGEQLAIPDASDCLDTLNDLLDSWSIQKDLIYGSVENILTLQSGKAQYRIGNPTNVSLGIANISGFTTLNSPIITGVTVPSTLVVGGTLTDTSAAIPTGTTVTAFTANSSPVAITFTVPPLTTVGTLTSVWPNPSGLYLITFSDGETRPATFTFNNVNTSWAVTLSGTPTVNASVNINSITMSANATQNLIAADVISYTIPGDFAIPRPNRITHGFTRFNQLDFTIEVTMDQSRFLEILYKAQPGPWPTVAWYNPQDPYGLINFYQTPGNNGELHLFTDTILSNLTLNQTFILPSGYTRALKWCLAKEICAEYGFPLSDAIRINSDDSMKAIKALNAEPAPQARYDSMLLRRNRGDASWITHGGYGR